MTPHQQLARVVNGAVTDAFNAHPDYLTRKGHQSARRSIVKRVTGTVLGFAVQHAAKGGVQPASPSQALVTSEAREGGRTSSQPFRVRIGRVTFKRASSSRQLLPFNYTLNRLRREMRQAVKHG